MAEEAKGVKASDLVEAIERFFLDLIGTVVPGLLLITGWVVLFGRPNVPGVDVLTSREVLVWLIPVLGYVLGHFVTGFGNVVVVRLVEGLATILTRLRLRWLLSFVASNKQINEKFATDATGKAFVDRATKRFPWLSALPASKPDLHTWRNIAMSVVTPDENHIVYRFMFISLLNLGAASACIALLLAWLVASVSEHLARTWAWGSVLFPARRPFDVGVLLVSLVLCYFFLERRYSFYKRALLTPFSMAIVKLDDPHNAQGPTAIPTQTRAMPIIYLAGGFRSGWQDRVSRALPNFRVIDPRVHALHDERQYTTWDLEGVRQSDWIIANLEATNPGGYALALEVGYAKALGKHIILIDEKSRMDEQLSKHLAMVRACAEVTTDSLAEAISFLQSLPISC